MNRQALRVIVFLGVVVSGVSGAGVFAEFADRATAGPNSVEMIAVPRVADIQLAEATVDGSGAFTCGDYGELLATPLFAALIAPHAVTLPVANACIRNVGAALVPIDMTVSDLVDSEVACTGDEALFDTTCGDNGAGELAWRLVTSVVVSDCHEPASGGSAPAQLGWLASGARIPIRLEQEPLLQSGVERCVSIHLNYAPGSLNESQAAQSDRVTWRFAFDAAVPEPGS